MIIKFFIIIGRVSKMIEKNKIPQWVVYLKGFVAGCVAGWSQVFVMQPFEIIKVRLVNDQLQLYKGFFDTFSKIVREEGPMALYKGTFWPLIGYGVQGSMQFGFNRFLKLIIHKYFPEEDEFHLNLISNFLTGVPSAFALTGADHIKTLMQKRNHGEGQKYTSQFDATKKIFKKHGIRGLYMGFNVTLLREVTANLLYFTSYEVLLKMMKYNEKKKDATQTLKILHSGGIAGICSWVFNYPVDFVKTKIQSQNVSNRTYKSAWDCFWKVKKQHGWKEFYRGLNAVVLRAYPVNAMAFYTIEKMKYVLNQTDED